MVEKRLINAQRQRIVPGSYSWVDHRLMRGGFLQELSIEEIGLYFFLVLVGDNRGLSYCRGRTPGYPDVPSQIPACDIPAPGSSETLASRNPEGHRLFPAVRFACLYC